MPRRRLASMACCIQLRIVAEDTLVTEGDSSRRSEICGDSRPILNSRMQCNESRILARGLGHCVRECVVETSYHLEHRKICIAELRAQKIALPGSILR